MKDYYSYVEVLYLCTIRSLTYKLSSINNNKNNNNNNNNKDNKDKHIKHNNNNNNNKHNTIINESSIKINNPS